MSEAQCATERKTYIASLGLWPLAYDAFYQDCGLFRHVAHGSKQLWTTCSSIGNKLCRAVGVAQPKERKFLAHFAVHTRDRSAFEMRIQ